MGQYGSETGEQRRAETQEAERLASVSSRCMAGCLEGKGRRLAESRSESHGAFRILTEFRTEGPIAANLQERMGDVNLGFCSIDFAIVEANP